MERDLRDMRKQIASMVLALVLVLTAAPMAWADETENGTADVAEVSGQTFATVQAAVNAAADGGTVKLLADADVTETIIVQDKTITLDLNEKTISNTADLWDDTKNAWSLISVRGTGNLTLTGNGALQAKENDCYAVDLQDAGTKCTIENGSYVGNISAVYVYEGTLIIQGGSFSIQQQNTNGVQDAWGLTINCYDASHQAGTAAVQITGGCFARFNPAFEPGADTAEHETPNFVPSGYEAVESGDDYIVRAERSHGAGGGSVSSGHSVSASTAQNGAVSVSTRRAYRGAKVTLRVQPESGYELRKLTVTDDQGNVLTLTAAENGTYTFVMPDSEVSVHAEFAPVGTVPFVDVSEQAYYYDSVRWAVAQTITTGTAETTFSPDEPCTRAQAVTFLWRAAGSPDPKSTVMPFTDVAAGSYYYRAVLWAVENGIAAGTDATTFQPDAVCSRAHIVSFLYRYAKASGLDTTQGGMAIREFDDFDTIPAYAMEPMTWAVASGLMQGSGNKLLPQAACTRAQIVTYLYRLLHS